MCKDIKDSNFPCECKDLQKDAKKSDSRNLSLFQIWLKKMEWLAEVHKAWKQLWTCFQTFTVFHWH